ncbi:MAG: cryptochrome/photolyase family protein [Alphaproteobacteria bacterium]|nr:cryptochrome/photolyase family protein [Alphaproteobacteria bacterium]
MTDTLRFLLGDQLSPTVSALRGADKARDVILFAEVADETAYVPHHKKKIAFVLAAMRAFAAELRADGWRVIHLRLDDPDPAPSLTDALARIVAAEKPRRVVVTEAGEWRVLQMQRGWEDALGVPVEIRADERFLCSHAEFRAWAEGKRALRMEFFYRDMRRRTGLLMDGDAPAGGRWNFDAENRKPATRDLFLPAPRRTAPSPETRAVLDLVAARFADNFGDLEPFWFAVDRAGAEAAFAHFLAAALPRFGETQDAMLAGEPFLNHAVISLYLNVGLLDPLEVCRRAEIEYRAGRAPLAAVEGFIRQILGWREFVRGIYWLSMPGYTARNGLNAVRPLPALYWSGETRMACMAAAIGQTKTEAYAHHIQRLMVTGNFALLAGLDPREVHEWYLAVYVDAFEWVEAPNTIGMSLFADGGLLASKPYAASGAYIDRMSDYCAGCAYDVDEKTGPKACPFNYLYWDFVARHQALIAANPRSAQIARTYAKLAPERQAAIADSAREFLARLDAEGTDA